MPDTDRPSAGAGGADNPGDPGQAAAPSAAVNKRSVIAGAIGNMLEWYDFAVFGFFAAAIGAQFFPTEDRLAGLLNTFAVFAVGYLARPIGGVLFGQ